MAGPGRRQLVGATVRPGGGGAARRCGRYRERRAHRPHAGHGDGGEGRQGGRGDSRAESAGGGGHEDGARDHRPARGNGVRDRCHRGGRGGDGPGAGGGHPHRGRRPRGPRGGVVTATQGRPFGAGTAGEGTADSSAKTAAAREASTREPGARGPSTTKKGAPSSTPASTADGLPAGLPMGVAMDGLPREVRIHEVGARDGLQNEKTTVPTGVKAEFVHRLAEAGLGTIEATSFVHPKLMPLLADLAERDPALRLPVLVPNERGLERALELGVQEFAVFGSATESFARANLNRTVEQSLAMFEPVVARARQAGARVRGY